VKKVILDENLPEPLRHVLADFEVVTVRFLGWSGIQNGELLKLVDQRFDVFLTGDKNLRYQQNLTDREIAIIEVPYTRLDLLESMAGKIRVAISEVDPGGYFQVKV